MCMSSTPQKSHPQIFRDVGNRLSDNLQQPGVSSSRSCKELRSKSAAPRLGPHVSSARAKLAEACDQFRETAVEVRRREKRLRQLERLAAEEDKENVATSGTNHVMAHCLECRGPSGVTCVVMGVPPAASNAAHRSSSKIPEEDLGGCNRERRIRKELRLERRMRRRAEEAAASVWRNTLLAAGTVSLCMVIIIALSVTIFVRR